MSTPPREPENSAGGRNQPSTAELTAHWQRLGPLLDGIRERELRALTDRQADESLGMPSGFALQVCGPKPPSSGTLEMRRLLDRHRSERCTENASARSESGFRISGAD